MFRSVTQAVAENFKKKKKKKEWIQIQQQKEMHKLSVAADKPLKWRKGRKKLTKSPQGQNEVGQWGPLCHLLKSGTNPSVRSCNL